MAIGFEILAVLVIALPIAIGRKRFPILIILLPR